MTKACHGQIFIEQYIEQSERLGEQRGEQHGEAKMLLRLTERKFGPPILILTLTIACDHWSSRVTY